MDELAAIGAKAIQASDTALPILILWRGPVLASAGPSIAITPVSEGRCDACPLFCCHATVSSPGCVPLTASGRGLRRLGWINLHGTWASYGQFRDRGDRQRSLRSPNFVNDNKPKHRRVPTPVFAVRII